MPDESQIPRLSRRLYRSRSGLPTAVVAALTLVGLTAPALAQDRLSRGDRRWLEEVEPIMTAQERQIFEEFPSGERGRFKEHFWARRSPNPHDPDSAEDAFNNWRKDADDRFGSRGRKGSRTDMALVMLLFGQPDNRETVGGRGGAGPGGARPPASATGNNPLAESGGAPGAGGGGGGRGGAGGGGGPSGGVKLSYVPNPDRGLPDGLTLEFRTTNLGMRLLRNDEIEAAIERARQRQIVWPSQINFTVNAEGRLPDVEDLFGAETRDLLDPNSPGKTILAALRGGGEASQDIGVDASFSFFRSNTGDTYVASVFELDEEKLTWNGDTASLQVFYNVVDALGTVIGYDERSVEVSRGAAGSPTILEMPMQMAPGSYKVFAGVRDPATDIHGALVREIESPDFSSGAFMLSSIVRFSDGARVEDFTPGPGRALLVGGFHFTPRLSEVYEPGGDLRLVFNAYGYDTSAEPNLDWQITFKKDGQRYLRYNPSAFNLASADLSISIVDVPLARLFADGRREDFEPGDYTAEITVRDRVGGQSLTEVVAFQVSGS